jgi:hypothetical protein
MFSCSELKDPGPFALMHVCSESVPPPFKANKPDTWVKYIWDHKGLIQMHDFVRYTASDYPFGIIKLFFADLYLW